MPHALVLQHVCFEDLGTLAPVLAAHGYSVEAHETPIADWSVLDPVAPDLLVLMGGPIGAYEDDLYPFLVSELALIEKRLATRRPTLGICLGAQLMARALGARVYPGPAKEIGWAPVELSEAGRESVLAPLAAEHTPVLHWHGDTFDLPAGATHLASTPVCRNQAYSWDGTALGLQFHPEVSARNLERWFVGHALEIAKTDGVSVGQLREDSWRWSDRLAAQARLSFDAWLSAVGSGKKG